MAGIGRLLDSRGLRRHGDGAADHGRSDRGALVRITGGGLADHAFRDPHPRLLAGGTDEQRQHWLPRIASGELLVGVAVTEPDIDPTWPRSVARRCEESMTESRAGSSKGRRPGPRSPAVPTSRSACPHGCDVRRQPRPVPVHRPEGPLRRAPFRAHSAGRWTITGTANPTPGYRGMHSFTLAIDHYFVPEENLVGGEEGSARAFISRWAASRPPADGRSGYRGEPGVHRESLHLHI